MIEATTIDASGTLNVFGLVEQFAKSPESFHAFSNMADLLLRSWWGETFEKQGARRGHEPWKPLSPMYATYKREQGQPARTMIATGHLQASPKILRETANSLSWGTDIPYAQYHQRPPKEGRPPQRELIFITNEDIGELEDFLHTFLEKQARSKYGG